MRASDASSSVDPADVARFDAIGDDWWNPSGSMRALHRINPLRIAWLRDLIIRHFKTLAQAGELPLAGLTILDIGCGAGLLAEPLARLGADVTGLDPAPGNIEVARRHAAETGARLSYRAATLEQLADESPSFDVVLAMEVVEHVRDMPSFVGTACGLVRPGGLFVASTLNRTLKSFVLAIVGAEYILRWVPQGTHRWEQFVTPEELSGAFRSAGLREAARAGMVYDPLRAAWLISRDMGVNYMIAAKRP
ncbi:bifunctional 2-polyprenyl-6-hydroxyphenol methylase/3-demethylubiquinol 3-O-methyltransferase UbiG [Methylocapsa sp. S129]|uniref:bifunctional 2-polyprenyl-6-hydroxyphenol methylase/3-demethylubiquinol 3-O-methyltransferase UbiG n=1 Tax=Methylocapsa sp. S129 TaxID=1641869 RepID=UPI00131C562E|nr:bifunctional 2-polyprenyl-6-hydroxyphenol methylase/3-demethylubiquinol 3-O-methyltransferase UbiG [Methylocapsa sp. S129]